MTWNERNLANTIQGVARQGRRRAPCNVPRPKAQYIYARIAEDEEDPEERRRILFDTAHSWSDRSGGMRGGICTRCGKSVAEIMVDAEPEEITEGSDAHLERAVRTGT